MYLDLSLGSLLKYSLSISDSILCLIICGCGMKMLICFITSSITWLCFSVFLAFITLTITESITFCLSVLISSLVSIPPAPGSGATFFLWVLVGMNTTRMLELLNVLVTFSFSRGENSGFLASCLSMIFCFGLQR